MIQTKLWAQLGNQCFMLAAAIAHAKKMNTTWGAPNRTIDPRIWKTYFNTPKAKPATLHYYKEKRHCYDPLPEVDDLTIEGYFQSKRYFQDAKEDIAKALGFSLEPSWSVAIHIRRGDYLKYPNQFPVLPIEYYQHAIWCAGLNGFSTFKIYSDDINWCKQNEREMFKTYGPYPEVEYSNEKDPLTDMKKIFNSSCLIIANSTFSLFPALLRQDRPIIYAPAESRWYGPQNSHMETFDLMPERFIKL
jgi:hypothetical protein